MPRRSTTAPEVSPPATTSRRTPDAHQTFRDIRHRLLNGMPGCIAAMTRLQSCDLVRRRAAGDQDRAAADSLARPSQRAPHLGRAGDDLFGIEVQHGTWSFRRWRSAASVACEQLPARHAAGPPTGAPAAAPAAARFDLAGGDQRPGEAEADAGRADRQAMIQRDAADGFEIAVEHGIDNSGARCPCPRDRQAAREPRPRRATASARSTSPTLVWLWRASTRTRLESCIGLSGWSFSGLSFSGTEPHEQIALIDGAAGLRKSRRHQHDRVAGIGAQRIHHRADIAGVGGIEGRADLEQHMAGAAAAQPFFRRARARTARPASIDGSSATPRRRRPRAAQGRRRARRWSAPCAGPAGQRVGEIGGAGVVVGDAAQRQFHGHFAPA